MSHSKEEKKSESVLTLANYTYKRHQKWRMQNTWTTNMDVLYFPSIVLPENYLL